MSLSVRLKMVYCIVFLCVSLLAWGASFAHAQGLPTTLGNVSLVVSPLSPAPHESASVSLDDYSVNAVGGTVMWYVNGVERVGDRNTRSISVTMGEPGTETTVRVSIVRSGVEIYTATKTITASVVDLVMEAQTYVPTFYRGRALPSMNAPIRVIAVVHDGSKERVSSYTYKWTRGTEVLFGGPVKGKQSVMVSSPLFGDEELYVQVFNTSGLFVGGGVVTLTAIEPELHFYEWSSLRGLLEKEVSSPFELFSEETTLYGEPYYLNGNPYASLTESTWNINGERVTGDEGRPHTITLSRQGESGKSYVEMTAILRAEIPQMVKRGIEVFFE